MYHPPVSGTTLVDLRRVSKEAGMDLEMVHIAPVGEIPVPSIVHLRSQHYSAIVGVKDGKYIVRDPGLGGVLMLTGAAIRDEASGYFLISSEQNSVLNARVVREDEASRVLGHCAPGGPAPGGPADPSCGGPGPGGPQDTEDGEDPEDPEDPEECKGMPSYRFHPQKVSLILDDVPVGYTPPVGPPINFHLSYDHREGRHPQTIDYGNVGPMWSHNWLSYVTEGPLSVMLRGQGMEWFFGFSSQILSQATLTEVSNDPPRYERRLPNGAVEIFELGDRPASQSGRRIFLTEVTDPQGHSVELTYDSSFRLVSITDALGQVTTLDYLDSGHPLAITKVTDPFGRFATMTYDASGRLTTVTDVVGMTSSFAYGDGDFIQAMTTPYGTTTFRHEPPFEPRRIEATDPMGGTERVEYHVTHSELPSTVASGDVPTGFSDLNVNMNKYNVLYWDKVAMAAGPTLSNATITSLILAQTQYGSHQWARNLPHSVKRPLESRVWYQYDYQTGRSLASNGLSSPITIARVLEGGASQVTELTYNSQGEATSVTDPLGRETTYSYDTNGLDLLEARQVVSGGTDLLRSFADYTVHLPETITDGAGNDTTITYNSFGQPLTVTNAKSETTTFAYETTTQNLLTVTGPVSGATTTFTYDAYNRVETVESSDGYVVVLAYDALDRLTSRTYPNDTTETFTYSRLDLVEVKDRLGRVTRYFYDRYGRRLATRDPAGRTVSLDWCSCGQLEALIDAKGQRTTWERDVQGRVTREIRTDGTTETLYTYDLTGRLDTITDPMDQVTTHTYNADNSLASTGFTNENVSTPDISHTYDTYYPRPLTMVDGNGTTSYTYKAANTDGAGKLASVDGPFSSDTIAYTYDELGRVIARMLNGSGTEITYDALGRLSQLEFPIGAFDYTYAGHTGRVSTVTYPNDQTSTYSYFDDEHDFRLQTIHHKNPSAATLSKFDYTYDTVGNILTWRQERAGSAAKIYAFTHDLVDQLTSAVLTDTNSTPTILKRQAWAYDVAGNRTVDQTDDAVFTSSHNSLNRLGSRSPGGPIVFEGSLNEEATVTIDGQAATVDASNNFRGTATLSGATTTVTLKARDASGNETTKQYEVDSSGSTSTYTYDANGNLTSDGTKTYYWNALNQLVEVKEGSTTIATFEYDGDGRRTEKAAGGITHTYVYDDEDIIEERITGSSSDTIRYYHGAGIDEPLARKNSSEVVTYYLADHLGSIVQESSAAGAITLEREYGPWGVAIQGASTSGYAFTGREWDAEVGLYYYRARYYEPGRARFLSDDPIGLAGGTNQQRYVSNSPTQFVDPFGLRSVKNNSKQTVYVKPEATGEAIPVSPGGSFPGSQDGLATPETRPGEVFKTSNGIDATVNPDGSVTTSGGSMLQQGVQWWRGGWQDEKWHQDLKKQGDSGWDELFNRSRPTPPKGGGSEEGGGSCSR